MDLFKKASLPSIEDYAKQLSVRQNLTTELGRSIRCLQEENVEKTIIADDECANSLCSVIEAIFIHGLKDNISTKFSSVFGTNSDKMPEPQFWTYVSKYCHKNVLMEIKNLTQISNDIGRSRAWLRISLNDGLIVSYLSTMLLDRSSLQKFYYNAAYLRDEEQSDIMKQLLEGTSVFHFELSCNNSALNVWNCLPLTLASLWTPPATPEPVMPAVDVIDFFTEQKSQGKSSSKADAQNSKNKDSSTIEVKNVNLSEYQYSPDQVSNETCTSTLPQSENLTAQSDKENATGNVTDSGDNCVNLNKTCDDVSKIQLSEPPEYEDTSSKISSSDSVPDFGNEAIDNSSEMSFGSMGNKLNEKSGWSSVFDYERDQKDNEAGQSYDSLLQSYNKNLSKVVIGTPELADTFASIMGKVEDEYINSSPEAKSPDSDFEIIPKYFTTDGADEETKRLLNIVGTICPEQGLDAQNFECYACGRPVGLIFGKARLCHYDGYNYCYECHDNDEFFIPARMIHNWDFNKYPVSKRSKAFLSRVVKDPMLDIKNLNPVIYNSVEEMAQLQLLRTQLTFLRSYIFTCKASVVEELRTRLWPREYLFEHVHLYSIDDMLEIPSGTLSHIMQKAIAFAKNHVSGCQLCLLKGFICEVCNNPKPIYPFDIESTYHCEKCLAVYHATCMDANKYCPKCARRYKRQQLLESASTD